jgi:hypothetical protein
MAESPTFFLMIRSVMLAVKRMRVFAFAALNINIVVFCNVTPCNLVHMYQRLRQTCSFHLHGRKVFFHVDDGRSKLLRNEQYSPLEIEIGLSSERCYLYNELHSIPLS